GPRPPDTILIRSRKGLERNRYLSETSERPKRDRPVNTADRSAHWKTVQRPIRIGTAVVLALTLILLVACGGGDSTPPVTPPSSTSLSYPSGTQTLVIGTAITPITPTITGTVSDFSVQPNLPAGLTLDSSKGTISGTPTAVAAAASYTISAGGAISATISIAVNDVPPKVSYGAASITFSANIASTTVTPTVTGGAVTSWSISPALPVGLSFDAHH